MVDQTTERTIIAATPDACYAAAIDFERYPEWASDVKMARILSRDDDGRAEEALAFLQTHDIREEQAQLHLEELLVISC